MEILSCSLLVCRAWPAQWRSVGAVAPEHIVASFLCSRLVSCTCALLWMFILTHATALKPFHSKQSNPLHHLQHLFFLLDFRPTRRASYTTLERLSTNPSSPSPSRATIAIDRKVYGLDLKRVWYVYCQGVVEETGFLFACVLLEL